MKRRDIRPGRVYEGTGLRIVTRKTVTTVYFIVLEPAMQRIKSLPVRPKGGGHMSLHGFAKWARREVSGA